MRPLTRGSIPCWECRSFVGYRRVPMPSHAVSIHQPPASRCTRRVRRVPLILSIGAATPDGTGTFVKCSDRPGIAIVGNSLAQTLAITPQTLRSKKISPVEYDTVDRMEINSYYIERKPGGEDWQGHEEGEPQIDDIQASRAKAWFDQLQNLTATSFDAATPEHLKQWSLDKEYPDLRIRLIAHLRKPPPGGQGRNRGTIKKGVVLEIYSLQPGFCFCCCCCCFCFFFFFVYLVGRLVERRGRPTAVGSARGVWSLLGPPWVGDVRVVNGRRPTGRSRWAVRTSPSRA